MSTPIVDSILVALKATVTRNVNSTVDKISAALKTTVDRNVNSFVNKILVALKARLSAPIVYEKHSVFQV